jgi:hypothetical protein
VELLAAVQLLSGNRESEFEIAEGEPVNCISRVRVLLTKLFVKMAASVILG